MVRTYLCHKVLGMHARCKFFTPGIIMMVRRSKQCTENRWIPQQLTSLQGKQGPNSRSILRTGAPNRLKVYLRFKISASCAQCTGFLVSVHNWFVPCPDREIFLAHNMGCKVESALDQFGSSCQNASCRLTCHLFVLTQNEPF